MIGDETERELVDEENLGLVQQDAREGQHLLLTA